MAERWRCVGNKCARLGPVLSAASPLLLVVADGGLHMMGNVELTHKALRHANIQTTIETHAHPVQ